MLNNLQINWDKMYNEPTNYSWADILYKIRCDDAKQNLILDKLNFADLTEYYVDNTEIFDALVVPNNKLEKKMAILQRVMNTSAKTLNVITSQRTTPFKKNGVTNIANFFELSDGQTITIFFHNPDTTPNKIAPTDDIISYKWLLNKKDITIVVAPEKGHDLNIREVAKRIMKLAEKNSAAFARANKKRAEKAELYSQTEKEVAELEKQLADLQQQLEIAKVKRDELQIKLAEQSQNDFRDDGVKVSIKDNEKLQEVNNVQPVDKNMQGDDTIPEADDNNFELSTQINQDIKDVVNTALAKSNELQQQLQSITDPIEYKLLSNKIKYLKALQSAMENRDSLFSKWDYGLDLSDMTDVDLIETDNIEKVIEILDKLATNKHYSISKGNLFKLIGFTPSENTQKQEVNNEKEIDFNSAFELIKISLSSSNDIKDAAQNKNLADFMKYYNHFVEKFLVNKYADATDNHPEKEFLIKMLNDDNLRISTFKDFGEKLYNKYNAETAENNTENLVEDDNKDEIKIDDRIIHELKHFKFADFDIVKNDINSLKKELQISCFGRSDAKRALIKPTAQGFCKSFLNLIKKSKYVTASADGDAGCIYLLEDKIDGYKQQDCYPVILCYSSNNNSGLTDAPNMAFEIASAIKANSNNSYELKDKYLVKFGNGGNLEIEMDTPLIDSGRAYSILKKYFDIALNG